MTSQTSRYGIKYPTGGDLVSDIPAHMQQAAQSIESALADVDDRHTTSAYSPVVRTTKYQLDQATRQPGQVGIVTAEPNAKYNHYYIAGVDRAWHRIYTDDKANDIVNVAPLKTYSVLWRMPFSNDKIRLTRVGQYVHANGQVKFNQSVNAAHINVNETLPAGFRPSTPNVAIVCAGGAYVALLYQKDGTGKILGNTNSAYVFVSGAWTTADAYPADSTII